MSSGTGNLGFYACGSILLLVCAMKLPALVRRRHDMLLRAACLLLLAAGCLMILAAPDSIVELNRRTGISNVSAPVVYAITTAFSGASLLLIINWRPAPPEETRRASRLCITAYSLTIIAIILLFWAGSAPVEQVALFDVYYANTPYLREMIVLYLAAQGVAMMTASALCWRWSREVHGFLRAGLRILAPAYLVIVSYDVIRLVAVTARLTGHDLDFLIKVSVQFAPLASLLGAIGFTLPLAGPRMAETLHTVRQLRQLAPLNKALEHVATPGAIRTTLPWWRTPPDVLLTGRKTVLYDAILALAPYYDPAVREAVRTAASHAALDEGGDESDAAVTADAVMIMIACERQRTSPQPQPEAAPLTARRTQDLIRLSQAMNSSTTRDLYEHHLSPQKAAHHD
ncbi:MAB_1171c family putative transporter [Streptomyces sp. SAS_260]|uniref:MAB_1171c family putative transporter n=1 Tax=Streptomyces sp. SAS_260 TaxID=3412751 RepID=UPI00403CD187